MNAAGQTSYYDAAEAVSGYTVSVTIGAGDCATSCASNHTWTYSVSHDGKVTAVGETGDPIDVPPIAGTSGAATANVSLVAGPVCPVERNPPDPMCSPRPVPNGDVIVRDRSGAEVAHGPADASGKVSFSVPGGAYYVEPATVQGLMGQAQAQAFSVVGGASVGVTLEYDTGIR